MGIPLAFLSAHGLRCVTYDRRGQGRSAESAAGYEFNTLSDDLSAVMQQLDLQHVTLVAHSMGCGELVRPKMMQWWIDMLLKCSMKVLLQLHRASTTADFRPDLRAMSLPTLIYSG